MGCDSILSHRFLRFDEEKEQLLPGIPNEITLDQICTKLPWRVLHILSSVSRLWKQAIQNRAVYHARIRSHSTETLVVCGCGYFEEGYEFAALYSMKDNSCHELPQFPTREYQCVSLAGTIYVLGGAKKDLARDESAEVYVLDLAGQRQWHQGAIMLDSQEYFGCGVLDGKIYVFGGLSRHKELGGASEMYDPKVGAWFPIKPMTTSRICPTVVAVGEELLVYCQGYSQAYHPAKREWSVIEAFLPHNSSDNLFAAKGKLYLMTGLHISIYDLDKNSSTVLQKNSFPRLDWDSDSNSDDEPILVVHSDPDDEPTFMGLIVTVNDELLAVFNGGGFDSQVLQSYGFGTEQKNIMWNRPRSTILQHSFLSFMCPVQL